MPSMPARSFSGRAGRLLMVAALGLCGCGGGTGRISGTVTRDGQPVKSGVITFVSRDGKGTMAPIKKDGTFVAANVPTGETLAILVNAMEEPDFTGPRTVSEAAKPTTKASAPPRVPTVIPEKFAKPETSGLTLTVRSGDNRYDIDVGK